MITRANEMKVDVHEGFRGGKGTTKLIHFMDKEDSCGAGRLFARGVLSPGSSVGYHAHEGDYEIYYILCGKGLGNDNGVECTLEAGDSFLTKNGSSHSLENIGDVDLEYIAIILFDKQ